MKIHLLILWTLAVALLEQQSLRASEILEETDKTPSVHKDSSSFMTHQEVENRLSQGLCCQKKLRIGIALAPAAQEYLTDEFIIIVQNFAQKIDIYEKCYVIRAVMKIPVQQLTTLRDILKDESLEQFQALPNYERVAFIKKLHKLEPNQWQSEIAGIIEKYHK